MNQELTAKLLDYLNNGEAFLKEQAPEFVKQAMAFYAWDMHFNIFCSIVFLIISIIIFVPALIWASNDGHPAGVIGSIGSLFGIIICSISLCYSIEQAKKIELAPKLFLLQELTGQKGCGK